MAKHRLPVRYPVSLSVPATGTGTIHTDPVRPGQRLVVQSVAYRNATAVRGSAVLQIRSGGGATVLAEEPAPPANEWVNYTDEQHLVEGDQVEVAQASCTASDALRLEVVGYLEWED